MQIFIQFITNAQVSLEIDPDDTVGKIKHKLAEKTGIDIAVIKFNYNGRDEN